MKKKIERGFIVYTKENDFGKVGCNIPLGHEYDEKQIEIELDKKLEQLKEKY